MAEDFENDEFEDEDEDDSSEDSGDKSGAAEEKSKGSEDSTASKRIKDLQSKADKAVAEANKLKKKLEEAESKAAKGVNEDEAEVPAAVKEWLIAAQDRAQTSFMDSDPRFKEYEVDPAFITGDSPAAMQDSAKALTKLVDSIEGKSRNKILVEHGFRPEPASSERNEPVNYTTMAKEEFAKLQEKALSGGFLKRN